MPPRGRGAGRPARPGNRGPRSTGPSDRAGVTGGPTTGDLATHRSRLKLIIAPVVDAAGYDLEELAVVRMGRRYVVQVTVDRDGGVPLDDIADLARDISTALDDAEAASGEFIAGEYQLEVSSPGVSRPLTEPRHWRRNVGRLVKVKIDGHTVLARIMAADPEAVALDIDGAERAVAYADLGKGRIEVEFSRMEAMSEDNMVDFEADGADEDGSADATDEDADSNDAEADDES
jgi:ribosome maturation factor RimP